MKRIITFGVVISMLVLLAGCGNSGSAPETSGQNSSVQQSETVPRHLVKQFPVKRMPAGNQMPARNRLLTGRLPSFTLPVTFLRRVWLPFMKPLAGNLPERLQ